MTRFSQQTGEKYARYDWYDYDNFGNTSSPDTSRRTPTCRSIVDPEPSIGWRMQPFMHYDWEVTRFTLLHNRRLGRYIATVVHAYRSAALDRVLVSHILSVIFDFSSNRETRFKFTASRFRSSAPYRALHPSRTY